MARVYISKKVKFQFFVNVESTTTLKANSVQLAPILEATTKSFNSVTPKGLVLFSQNHVTYIPKLITRLRYIRSQKPLLFLQNTNPKVADRRIHKLVVQVDRIMSLKLSIVCGSCRKLKNDCNCDKSHYMVRCFVNLMGRANAVPVKLCVRKLGVLFSLLDVSAKEQLCVLGFLVNYDKLEFSYKEFIKFTDIKFSSGCGCNCSREHAQEEHWTQDLLRQLRELPVAL